MEKYVPKLALNKVVFSIWEVAVPALFPCMHSVLVYLRHDPIEWYSFSLHQTAGTSRLDAPLDNLPVTVLVHSSPPLTDDSWAPPFLPPSPLTLVSERVDTTASCYHPWGALVGVCSHSRWARHRWAASQWHPSGLRVTLCARLTTMPPPSLVDDEQKRLYPLSYFSLCVHDSEGSFSLTFCLLSSGWIHP